MSNNIYYLGKLRRTREFIKSFNLSNDEHFFWESWFNRCIDTYQLMPFLKKNKYNSKLWVFVIKSDSIIRFGLVTLSEDLSGRRYPFLIYKREKFEGLELDETSNILTFFLRRILMFSNILNQGYFNNDIYELFVSDKQTILLELENEKNVLKNLTNGIDDEYHISNWVELNSNKYITHTNALTCSLYNKIFG